MTDSRTTSPSAAESSSPSRTVSSSLSPSGSASESVSSSPSLSLRPSQVLVGIDDDEDAGDDIDIVPSPSPSQSVLRSQSPTRTRSPIQTGDGIIVVPPPTDDGDLVVTVLDEPVDDNVITEIVDVTIFDGQRRPTQPSGPVTICFSVPDGVDESDTCLGTVEARGEDWQCQDCVEERDDGLVCGSTDHLSLFALIEISGTDGEANDRCNPTSGEGAYITGVGWGDAVLTIGAILIVCCLALVALGILIAMPSLHGKEFTRVRNTRTRVLSSHSTTVV